VSKRCVIVCVGVLAAPAAASAGAWTMPEGTGQVIATATTSTADRVFGLGATPRYDKTELQALIEYGFTDRFTGIFMPGLQHVGISAPIEAQRTGLGYTELGGRYRVLQGDAWVLSGQATVRVPGTNATSNPAAIGYTGVETDIRALLGYSFMLGAMPAFIDLQLAQRFRAGAPPDELRVDATFGVRPAPRWLLLAQSFNVISEGRGSPPFASYDYYKLQLSAVYALTPALSLQAGGFTTFAGSNALQENGLILGAWYRF
jgi:Ca2+-binding RTX toxin-like protein